MARLPGISITVVSRQTAFEAPARQRIPPLDRSVAATVENDSPGPPCPRILLRMVDVELFIRDGFVKLEQPALRDAACAAHTLLWRQIAPSPDDASTWTHSVVWTADLTGLSRSTDCPWLPELAGDRSVWRRRASADL